MPKEKVKIIGANDNDTFTVLKADGSKKEVRLLSKTGMRYDGFEKNQPGFKLDDAVTSLINKEVTVDFKVQTPRELEENYFREKGSISTSKIPDLAEHLYKKNQLWRKQGGNDWEMNGAIPTDSLTNPVFSKGVEALLLKNKADKLPEKQRLAFSKEITKVKEKYGFQTNEEVLAFVSRRSKIPHESLKTFQLQVPIKQSTMATPIKNKSLKVSGKPEYKDP